MIFNKKNTRNKRFILVNYKMKICFFIINDFRAKEV